jgi:hypothetical protein
VFKYPHAEGLKKSKELHNGKAVIVMVNTSYNFITLNNTQASNTTHVSRVVWLSGKNMPYDPNKAQAGLMGLV